VAGNFRGDGGICGLCDAARLVLANTEGSGTNGS
jgi:hypothetical protein